MKDLMKVAYIHCDGNCKMCHRKKIEEIDLEKDKEKLKEKGVLLEKDGKLILSGACVGKIKYDDKEGKGIDLKIHDSKIDEMHVSSDEENVNLKIGGKTFVGELNLGVNKEIAKKKWWEHVVPLADKLKTRIEGIVNNRDTDSVELKRYKIKYGSHIPVEEMRLKGKVLIGKYANVRGPIEAAYITGEGKHAIHELYTGAPTNVRIEVNEEYEPTLELNIGKIQTYVTTEAGIHLGHLNVSSDYDIAMRGINIGTAKVHALHPERPFKFNGNPTCCMWSTEFPTYVTHVKNKNGILVEKMTQQIENSHFGDYLSEEHKEKILDQVEKDKKVGLFKDLVEHV